MPLEYSLPPQQPTRVRSLRETADIAGVSLKTLRNLIEAGKGPVVTRVSERCVGIRDDHRQAWLDRCASPEPA